MKNALILYPHQLFPVDKLPEVQRIVLVEDPLLFGMDQSAPLKLHKQKLILSRASMQRYVEEVLWPAGYQVDYIELDIFMNTADLLEHVKSFEQVYIFDPVDELLTARLLQARRERQNGPPIDFLPSPNFYLKEQEIREYLSGHSKSFSSFYQWQRERFDILIGENYKPLGGKWIFDSEKQLKPAKDQTLPSFAVFGDNKHAIKATAWVNEHFPDNPGSTDFIWPTNYAEAEAWLEDFVENRIDDYAQFQDAIHNQAPWLFHSALSSSLNIGLLSPQQVVDAALRRHAKRPVDLSSLESFIRQILGWREYLRGVYVMESSALHSPSPFKSQRHMTQAWREGNLGLPPFDDLVRKLKDHGYAHNIERLMIAGNLMLLCEIHPDEVRKWFGELFVDTLDWIVSPNVYNLYQLTNSNLRLAIVPSTVILQMSNYERGDWADVWDGLYWRFVEKHKEIFRHNPRLRPVVQRLERLDSDRKRIIGYRADDFLANFTQ
jgi:deoxyribodipyrimidine photolyase-related protein